jgi:hypothetical protein
MPVSQREVEKRLDLVCLEISQLQEAIWEQLDSLERGGLLLPQMEEHAGEVMRDVSFSVDQCTLAAVASCSFAQDGSASKPPCQAKRAARKAKSGRKSQVTA